MTTADWRATLPALRQRGLLGRLAFLLDNGGALTCPDRVRDHLEAAATVADKNRRSLRWEIDRIGCALKGLDAPVVLLKGAAYSAAGLPPARGRLASDVDILVPKDVLPAVEAALLGAGWEATKTDPYDQRYYRQWMHELPPLRHSLRNTFVDVHHAILPVTSRLQPSSAALFQDAVPLENSRFHVLSPVDMALHSATHLFYDGDFDSGLRDLVDLHDLLECFGRDDRFWQALVPRAVELNLQFPLFFALRYCGRFLETKIPAAVTTAATVGAPSRVPLRAMDVLFSHVVFPHDPGATSVTRELARLALYLRGHYIRMPLHLLIPHLVRKAIRGQAAEDPL